MQKEQTEQTDMNMTLLGTVQRDLARLRKGRTQKTRHQQRQRQSRTICTLGQRNTGENNQGKGLTMRYL